MTHGQYTYSQAIYCITKAGTAMISVSHDGPQFHGTQARNDG